MSLLLARSGGRQWQGVVLGHQASAAAPASIFAGDLPSCPPPTHPPDRRDGTDDAEVDEESSQGSSSSSSSSSFCSSSCDGASSGGSDDSGSTNDDPYNRGIPAIVGIQAWPGSAGGASRGTSGDGGGTWTAENEGQGGSDPPCYDPSPFFLWPNEGFAGIKNVMNGSHPAVDVTDTEDRPPLRDVLASGHASKNSLLLAMFHGSSTNPAGGGGDGDGAPIPRVVSADEDDDDEEEDIPRQTEQQACPIRGILGSGMNAIDLSTILEEEDDESSHQMAASSFFLEGGDNDDDDAGGDQRGLGDCGSPTYRDEDTLHLPGSTGDNVLEPWSPVDSVRRIGSSSRRDELDSDPRLAAAATQAPSQLDGLVYKSTLHRDPCEREPEPLWLRLPSILPALREGRAGEDDGSADDDLIGLQKTIKCIAALAFCENGGH